jgi:molecular chaperone DnaK
MADTLAYSTEKTLRESGERISDTDKESVQNALNRLREALKGSDMNEIRSAREALEQVWQPIAANLYSQAGAGAGQDGSSPGEPGAGAGSAGDDVVDAEFRSSEES